MSSAHAYLNSINNDFIIYALTARNKVNRGKLYSVVEQKGMIVIGVGLKD